MVFKIIFFSQAALELEEAIAWYEIQHPKHGKEFFSIIEISIDKISQNPFTYLFVRIPIRRYVLRKFPYSLYFEIEDDVVRIASVWHHKRDKRK